MPSLADFLGDMFLSEEERKRREHEARYGKNRMLPPEEAANLARSSGMDLGGLNPYASANRAQAPQIMQGWQKKAAEAQKPEQPSHLNFLDPQMYKYAGGTAKSLSSAAYDPTQESLSDYYRQTIGKRVVPQQAVLQRHILQQQADEFQEFRAQKNQEWDKYDPIARSQIRSMNKMADSLDEAYKSGRLRDEEYFYAQAQLGRVAANYKWDSHTRVPGAQPGDIFDQDGIISMREADGGVKIVGATPEWQEKMKTPIHDAKGNLVGYNLLDPASGKTEQIKLKEYTEMGADLKAIQAQREEDERNERRINEQAKLDKEVAIALQEKPSLRRTVETALYGDQVLDYYRKRKSGELPPDAPFPQPQTSDLDDEIAGANTSADAALEQAIMGMDQADAQQKAAEAVSAPETPAPQPTAAGQPKTANDALAIVAADQAYRNERALATTPAEKASVDAKHWRNYPPMVEKAKRAKPVENYKSLDAIPSGTVVELPTGELAYVFGGKAFLLPGANLTELTSPSSNQPKQQTVNPYQGGAF